MTKRPRITITRPPKQRTINRPPKQRTINRKPLFIACPPRRTLTVTKMAEWVDGKLDAALETSTGEALPLWLARAIAQNAPCGAVVVAIYHYGARLTHESGWTHDVGKPGRR